MMDGARKDDATCQDQGSSPGNESAEDETGPKKQEFHFDRRKEIRYAKSPIIESGE